MSDNPSLPDSNPPVKKPDLDYIHPEDWRILQRIANGSKITERETPNFGMPKSFTVGKGRMNWNSCILDNLAAHGYLNRATNKITAEGTIALLYREIIRD